MLVPYNENSLHFTHKLYEKQLYIMYLDYTAFARQKYAKIVIINSRKFFNC